MQELPPLPIVGQDPWFGPRDAFDRAVKQRLEGGLIEDFATERVAGAIAPATALPEESSFPRLTNPTDEPIFSWSDAVGSAHNGIYWPNLVNLGRRGGSGVALMHSSDHATHAQSGFSLARADSILQEGGFEWVGDVWRDDTDSATQCETPSFVTLDSNGDWLFSYQLATVPGATTDQSSMIARCTAADLESGWSRVGFMNNPAKRDFARTAASHTGYASPWAHAGQFYAVTLLNGNTSGTFMGAQSLIASADGKTWVNDPRPLYMNPTLVEQFPGYDKATKWVLNPYRSTPFRWQGEWWIIGTVGPSASGTEAQAFQMAAVRLSNDFRRVTSMPFPVSAPAQSWETGPIDQIGAVYSERGRLFLPYRSGGKSGSFGVKEIV